MNIILNEYCNLNCSYCFAQNARTNKYMSIQNFNTVINFLKKSNIKVLKLLGGEPTLHPNFVDIVQQSISDDFFGKIVIFTNGLELTKNLVDKISSKKIEYLINLNSPKFIGEIKYSKTLDNIKYLTELNTNTIILGINIFEPKFEYSYFIDVVKQNKIQFVRFSISCPITTGENASINYYRQFMPQLVKFIDEIREQNIVCSFDCPNIPVCLYNEFNMDEHLGLHWDEEYKNICIPVVDVTPDLKITRCFPFIDKVLLDINNFENIEQINSKFINTIDSKDYSVKLDPNCKNCNKKNICQMGCKAFYYNEGEI